MNAAAAVLGQSLSYHSGGLALRPADTRRAVRACAFAIIAVTAVIVMVDAAFYRNLLRSDYVTLYTAPLWPRTPIISLIAIGEELRFRLILMSALFALGVLVRGRVSVGWAVAAIILSQIANVGLLLVTDPVYGLFRWLLPGLVWGWLYWRHGWFAAAAAHGSTHLLMDPILMLALS